MIETMIKETSNADNKSSIAVAAFIAGVVVLCVSGALAYLIVKYYRKRTGSDMNFDNPVYKKTTTADDGVNMNQRFAQNGSVRTANFPHIQYGVPITEDAIEPLTKHHQMA